MRLQPRDVEIVDAVHRHRVLSTEQIAALFFPTATVDVTSACRTRLRLLAREGLLERAEQEQIRSEGRRPYLYMLTHEGAQLLVDELGLDEEDIDWRPSYNNVRWPFLRHQLAINQAYVAFRLGAEDIGWRLEHWTDDRILRRHHVERVYVPEANAEVAIVPDAYMVLSGPDGSPRLQFFLEIDRATLSVASTTHRVKSWQDKIRAYQAYFGSQQIVARYGTRRIRVLTVTTSATRCQNLKKATEAHGGRSRYWFTTEDDIVPATALRAPIWRAAGKEKALVLVERP